MLKKICWANNSVRSIVNGTNSNMALINHMRQLLLNVSLLRNNFNIQHTYTFVVIIKQLWNRFIIMKTALFFQLYIKETSTFFRWTVREEKHAINGTIPRLAWNGIHIVQSRIKRDSMNYKSNCWCQFSFMFTRINSDLSIVLSFPFPVLGRWKGLELHGGRGQALVEFNSISTMKQNAY